MPASSSRVTALRPRPVDGMFFLACRMRFLYILNKKKKIGEKMELINHYEEAGRASL